MEFELESDLGMNPCMGFGVGRILSRFGDESEWESGERVLSMGERVWRI